jgi:hypothetical protein
MEVQTQGEVGLHGDDEQSVLEPSITFLNMSGDVTITWDDQNKADVEALVARKMAEGYSFFIVKPVGTRGRAPKLKEASQLEGIPTRALKMHNEFKGQSLSDEELVKALTSGVISIERKPETVPAKSVGQQAARRASTAREVVEAQSVAVKPITGG